MNEKQHPRGGEEERDRRQTQLKDQQFTSSEIKKGGSSLLAPKSGVGEKPLVNSTTCSHPKSLNPDHVPRTPFSLSP